MKTNQATKFLSVCSIIFFCAVSVSAAAQASENSGYLDLGATQTPIPTYDPLAEPIIPANPTELDLGRNWYWHNCMTCHGDVGQGLTDEFRAIWPEDHQNCWAHGCHGGGNDDEGFEIPRVVPPLVSADKLNQFPSQESFYSFLKSTHPPQTPGVLENKQYMAIVKFLFTLNGRPIEDSTPVPDPNPSEPPKPSGEVDLSDGMAANSSVSLMSVSIFVGCFLLVLFFLWRTRAGSRGS